MKPEDIEKLSFQIIDKEAGAHDFSPEEWNIVRRMIHTSADFEYMETVRFHPHAIQDGLKAICSGKTIVTDTDMARVGLRKRELKYFGAVSTCLIHAPSMIKQSKDTGMTRARLAVDAAIPLMEDGIYVVGNAPTALLRLIELINEKKARPALIIAVPVGFVNAAESKAALMEIDHPYISNVGRKGGSNLAASIVNAISIMAIQKDHQG